MTSSVKYIGMDVHTEEYFDCGQEFCRKRPDPLYFRTAFLPGGKIGELNFGGSSSCNQHPRVKGF